MDFEILVDPLPIFTTKNDKLCAMLEFMKPDKIRCWAKNSVDEGLIPLMVNIANIPIDELKEIKVWNKLDKKMQGVLEGMIEGDKAAVLERMEKARRGRRKKYPDMPKEYRCIICDEPYKIQPSTVRQRLEKKGILLDDFIKTYECRKCNPGWGKKTSTNPQAIFFKTLPTELVCKCGRKVKANYTYLTKRAEKLGVTMDSLVRGYSCQKCSPTIGRREGWNKPQEKKPEKVIKPKKMGKRGRPKGSKNKKKS